MTDEWRPWIESEPIRRAGRQSTPNEPEETHVRDLNPLVWILAVVAVVVIVLLLVGVI